LLFVKTKMPGKSVKWIAIRSLHRLLGWHRQEINASLRLLKPIRYQIHTLWLFCFNDLKTMVFPSIAFAYFHSSQLHWITFLSRLPLMFAYTWFNLLGFTINNQRHPGSVAEDKLNKPWRPIAAGRLTPSQAHTLGRLSIPIALAVSAFVGGGVVQSALLAIFGTIYNDFGGGDGHWLMRNLLNAAGFTSFASGTLEVALQTSLPQSIIPWIFLIALVVGTSVHVQDMYDQPGDAAAGRRTLPLVIGDEMARWSIAVVVTVWSILCPLYWSSDMVGYLAPLGLGIWVSLRSLTRRTVKEDRTTFRIYNAWLVALYALPMTHQVIISV
jgi:4-hydroxybenzoate polyprenyltransferase